MRYFFGILTMAVLFPFLCLAQEENELEPWLDLIKEDAALAELLQDLQENPIVVNKADKADWQRIPLLSASVIDKILEIRRQKGPFKSLRPIKAIVGAEQYRRIRPFIVLNPPLRRHFYWLQRNYQTIENPQNRYSGSKVYNLTKLHVKYNNKIDAGMIAQKDAGETQWADYLNGYVRFNGKKIKIIAGSFYLQLGQGLIFSSPFGRMKSTLVTLPFTSNKDRMAAYSGSAENFAQTGLCAQIQWPAKTTVRFAFSRTLRDGQYNAATGKIIGFDYTGYHRNSREESRKDLIEENALTLNFNRKISAQANVGILLTRFVFNPSIDFNSANVPFSELRRRRFHFNGRFLDLAGIYYRFANEHLSLAGEWAVSDFKHHAFNQSMLVKETNVKFGVILWQLNRNFQTPSGRVFDDRTPFPGAQQGVYGALTYDFGGGTIRFYKFIKQDLWRTYFEPLPTLHDEWLSQIAFRFSRTKLNMRLRRRFEEEFLSTGDSNGQRMDLGRTSLRLEAWYGPSKKLRLRTRLEWCRVEPPKEKGILMFQDIGINALKNVKIHARVTFFRTTSYASRIYEYEYDVPGSFSNVALYGQGFKWYGQVNWRVSRGLRVWLKYRYLFFNERNFNVINYGRIKRPLQRLVRLQFELRF